MRQRLVKGAQSTAPRLDKLARKDGAAHTRMKEKPLRAALYARSEDRDGEVEPDLEELRTWCRREGWQIAEEYADYATPLGSTRDDFGRLLEDARSGRFEIVLFTTLRNFLPVATRETVRRLMELDRLDVMVAALFEPEFSTVGVEGHRLRRALAILEAQQHRHIATRVRSGMARMQLEGRPVGRPRLPVEKRRKIVALRGQGRSVAETAQAVGVSESTVVKYQRRPVDDLLELVVRSRES